MSTFGFFMLFGVYGYLVHLHGGPPRWLMASALSLCIATLLRPEGAMIFVVLAGLGEDDFFFFYCKFCAVLLRRVSFPPL